MGSDKAAFTEMSDSAVSHGPSKFVARIVGRSELFVNMNALGFSDRWLQKLRRPTASSPRVGRGKALPKLKMSRM